MSYMKMFERPRESEEVRKTTLFLTEEQHNRFLKLVLPLGSSGVEFGHRHEIETHLDYSKRLRTFDVSDNVILKWLLSEREESAIQVFMKNFDCSFVKEWSISERLEILGYIIGGEDHIDFLKMMENDPSLRVKSVVEEALKAL